MRLGGPGRQNRWEREPALSLAFVLPRFLVTFHRLEKSQVKYSKETAMPYSFQKMQLEAQGFYDLIGTWAEMQLVVTQDSAVIIGDGYTYEISEAFTALVLDWEAHISLPKAELGIPEGSYDLSRKGDIVHACRGEKFYPLADQPVALEVISVPEE